MAAVHAGVVSACYLASHMELSTEVQKLTMTDKNRTKRRSRKYKEFNIPANAQKISYPVYLGDCGETVMITWTKKGAEPWQKSACQSLAALTTDCRISRT